MKQTYLMFPGGPVTARELDQKLDALHQGISAELNKAVFPFGREVVALHLDQKIHNMSFNRKQSKCSTTDKRKRNE